MIYYIETDEDANAQEERFCTNSVEGLTQAGSSRINQSIEASVYFILGSQVNVRSSILGSGGHVKEVQREFLVDSKIPNCLRRGKGAAQPCCVSGGLIDAFLDGD